MVDMENTTTAQHHTRNHRRPALLIGGLIIGAVAIGAIGAGRSAASPATDQRICTWRPAADAARFGIQFGPSLLGTVRLQNGRVEVLHHVTCSDGSVRDAWMAAID